MPFQPEIRAIWDSLMKSNWSLLAVEKATIFTHDTDFLQIAARWMEEGRTHHGIIYCHQKSYTVGECIRKLRMLNAVLTSEDMIDHIEFL